MRAIDWKTNCRQAWGILWTVHPQMVSRTSVGQVLVSVLVLAPNVEKWSFLLADIFVSVESSTDPTTDFLGWVKIMRPIVYRWDIVAGLYCLARQSYSSSVLFLLLKSEKDCCFVSKIYTSMTLWTLHLPMVQVGCFHSFVIFQIWIITNS